MDKKLTFFQEQFSQTGLTKADNSLKVKRNEDSETITEIQIYQESNGKEKDEEQNVRINFPDLYGGVYTYETSSKSNPEQWFFRTRLANPKIGENGRLDKYKSPYGSGIYPFFNKKIIETYQRAINGKELYEDETATIDTLVITEGEKKASRLCSLGVFAVGITGITMWRNQKGMETLHSDIEELMLKCKVKTLVFIKDADAVSTKYDAKADMSERPNLFYTNIMKFAEATSYMIDSERHELKRVVYGHTDKTYIETAKGIDDLINLNREDELTEKEVKKLSKPEAMAYTIRRKKYVQHLDKIIQDLTDLSPIGSYFRFFDLNHSQGQKNLVKAFGLLDSKNFYGVYGSEIGNRPFIFKRRQYQHDGQEVVFMKHHDTDNFAYVHDALYKKVPRISEKGEKTYYWKDIREAFVKTKYKNYPNFMDSIPRYEAYFTKPDNTETFQQSIDNCFNLYNPLPHLSKKGKWDSTYKFLKHLFRGNSTISFDSEGNYEESFLDGDSFAIMIDWLTILIQKPLEKLPVPCLYSPENGTGKSTLMELVVAILGENGVILSNEEFLSQFNAHYVSKAFIGLDEAMIEKDVEKERLKKFVTSKTVMRQNKGKDYEKVTFFAKFIFCTNKKNFMKVELEETRWYILRVFPFNKSEQIPNILDQYLIPEVPYFLHYLKTRKIFHPYISRTWFDEKHYVTQQFLDIVQKTKSYTDTAIDEFIVETFNKFGLPTIRMTLEFIVERIGKTKYTIDKKAIKDYLKDKRKLEPSKKTEYVKMPIDIISINQLQQIDWRIKTGKPYIFEFKDWLSEQEQIEFLAHDPIRDEVLKNSGFYVAPRTITQLPIDLPETMKPEVVKIEVDEVDLSKQVEVPF